MNKNKLDNVTKYNNNKKHKLATKNIFKPKSKKTHKVSRTNKVINKYINYLNLIKTKLHTTNTTNTSTITTDSTKTKQLKPTTSPLTLVLLHPLYLESDTITQFVTKYKSNILINEVVSLSRNAILGLTYNINILQHNTNLSYINKQVSNQGYTSTKPNKLHILLLENIDSDIKKLKAEFNNVNYRTIITNPSLLLDTCNMLFNNNSLLFLEEQLLNRFIKQISTSALKLLLPYKHYLETTIYPRDHDKFMILGGNVLSAYGLRKAEDLDIIISNRNPVFTENFNDVIYRDFINPNRTHQEWDAIHPDLKWKQLYTKFHKDWAASAGASSIIECIHNPKYHFYFLGLKFINLDLEIYRRNIRNRPAAVADLIATNTLLNRNVAINPISKNYIYIYDDDVKEVFTSNINFIKSINYHLKNKYKIQFSLSKISKLITFIQ
jgi:hypothetical protein